MLGIVATLNVRPGMEAEFERVACDLADTVRANEPGCLSYAVFQGETAGTYHFIESYADQAALDAHRAAEYSARLGNQIATTLLAAPPTVLRMSQLAASGKA